MDSYAHFVKTLRPWDIVFLAERLDLELLPEFQTVLKVWGDPTRVAPEEEWALLARARSDFGPVNPRTLATLRGSGTLPSNDLRWLMLCAAHVPRVRSRDLESLSRNVYDTLHTSRLPPDLPEVPRIRCPVRMDALVATYNALDAKLAAKGRPVMTKRQMIAHAAAMTNNECTLLCGVCSQLPRKHDIAPLETRPRLCNIAVVLADGAVWRVVAGRGRGGDGAVREFLLRAPDRTAAIVQLRRSTEDPKWALFVRDDGGCKWGGDEFRLPLSGSSPVKFAAAANLTDGGFSLVVGGDTNRRGVWTQCFDISTASSRPRVRKTADADAEAIVSSLEEVVAEANDLECPLSFVSLMQRGAMAVVFHGNKCLYETRDAVAVAAGSPDNFLVLHESGPVTHVSGTWSSPVGEPLPGKPVAACVLDEA